jgi:hypothetical protein
VRRVAFIVVLAVAASGCGDGTPTIHAQIASHPAGIGTGQQRVLIGLIDLDTNRLAASPDVEVTATLRDRSGSPLATVEGEFVWIVPNVRGVYSFQFDIPDPGDFQVTLDAGPLGRNIGPIRLTARADTPVVGVGDTAPLSETRTIPEYELRDITSDPEPDPRFYQMTVAEAVTSGPSVIVFGTPAWCSSQACGPMLAQVRGLAPEFPDLNFVHVEIYENIHVNSFEELELVAAVAEWGLVSEPFIFVTDRQGRVFASFEGAASDNELRVAFTRVLQ